jgi:hypothetical protein
MKKSLRIALAAAVLTSFAPCALAHAPGGTNPEPKVAGLSSISTIVSAILTVLSL